MKIEQIYTGCLAQGAYYIESAGEAAIIDPLRESQPYIEKAGQAKIKYIFETHFHADFVSGHVSLAEKTGASIVFGPLADTAFTSITAKDGQEFEVGKVKIKVLHTPGHTAESSTFLLINEEGEEHAIFTGDTLFIGDVGRPDLAVKSDLTAEDLAGMLYESLRNKIMPLPDHILVYPAHGAGSACGKNMSKETYDLLGHQKQVNYALRADMTKEEFVAAVTHGLPAAPQYFPKNVALNKGGYEDLERVMLRGNIALNPADFLLKAQATNALTLDTRAPQRFKDGHIPNSINIGIDGGFAPWVGALILDLKQPILIVAEEGRSEEIITRLSRVGYDQTIGYLEGGIDAWKAAGQTIQTITSISATEFSELLTATESVLDVRKTGEYLSEHIDLEGVISAPLDTINDWWPTLDKNKTYYVHCAGGYRSMITASILKSRGIDRIIDIAGGFKAIKATNVPKTTAVCPSTLR
ncbi:MBL fold metallo-hydrolase [Persicobacter psychrovividus]|uniref:MBL fold metallo-hydrolase n=1 Tax=Persicobacter psychrovividus TaxID=387638 RepID=A0ABN6LFH9_9BACT|nr:MBL fold metallo-hydrolase [Persicobacter psychrovividus]